MRSISIVWVGNVACATHQLSNPKIPVESEMPSVDLRNAYPAPPEGSETQSFGINASESTGNRVRSCRRVFCRSAKFMLLLGSTVSLGACEGAFEGLLYPAGIVGAPSPYTEMSEEIEELEDASNSEAIERYMVLFDDPNTSDEDRHRLRNNIVTARLQLIDLNYHQFVLALNTHRNSRNILLESVGLGLTAAASVVGGQAAIQALSATATGVGGLNATLDAELYYAQTLPVIITQMEADRARERQEIVGNLERSVGDYPLFLALSDLDSYYRAGSLHGAIVGLTSGSGSDLEEANKDIQGDLTLFQRRIELAQFASTSLTPERAVEILDLSLPEGESGATFALVEESWPVDPQSPSSAKTFIVQLLLNQTFRVEDLTKWEEAIRPAS